MPCWISGTSSLKSALTNSGSARRQDQARALGRLLEALEHRADGVALVEVLAVVLLAVGDDRLRLAELVEHDDQLAALDLLDLAGEELADLVGELVADARALALAHPLDDPLLGRLHRQPPEGLEGDVLLEHVAELELGVLEPGLLDARSGSPGPPPPRRPGGAGSTRDGRPAARPRSARSGRSARTSGPARPGCRRAAGRAVPHGRAAWWSSARGTPPAFQSKSPSSLHAGVTGQPRAAGEYAHCSYTNVATPARLPRGTTNRPTDGNRHPGPAGLSVGYGVGSRVAGVKKNVGELPHITNRPRTGGLHSMQ